MSCFHPEGLNKRLLYRQVEAASKHGAGTAAHLAAIKAFHASAWRCFDLRKVDPPAQRTQYCYGTRQADYRTSKPPKAIAPEPITRATKKAIYCVELDASYCWQELNQAIEACPDGTRSKIACIAALARWRKHYDAHWDTWPSRSKKKLPANLKRLKEFGDTRGQIHFVAGSDAEGKIFGTGKEAQRHTQSCEAFIKAAEAEQLYHSETNQELLNLFDRTAEEPELWAQLEQALKQAEAEERRDDESDNQSTDESDG